MFLSSATDMHQTRFIEYNKQKDMDNIHEVKDTGDKDDLDESDQLPVRAGDGSDPFCYICTCTFGEMAPKSTPEVYSASEMLPDREDEGYFNYCRLSMYRSYVLFAPRVNSGGPVTATAPKTGSARCGV